MRMTPIRVVVIGLVLGVVGGVLLYACPARVFAQVQLGPTPTSSGLLAAYAMTTTADASGNGHTATFTATTTTPGRYGDAQAFNGTTSRMTIPGVMFSSAFTVEAWVRLMGITRSVVGRHVEPRDPAYWQAIVYRSLDNVFIAEAGGFFTAGFTPQGGAVVQITSPTPSTPGTFHHVAATYDGATLALVVDGVQVASRPATGTVATTGNPLEVGSSAIDGGYMAGVIDDVRVYSRALMLAEVAVDLATPVDTVREDVVSWDLDVFSATGAEVGKANFLRSGARCGLDPLPPPAGTVRNPTTARVTDPAATAKDCELAIEAFVVGLPVGTGYTSIARARGATTVSGPSPASNPFDRVALAVPPASPGSTILTR